LEVLDEFEKVDEGNQPEKEGEQFEHRSLLLAERAAESIQLLDALNEVRRLPSNAILRTRDSLPCAWSPFSTSEC
jgi:hypothetical protein